MVLSKIGYCYVLLAAFLWSFLGVFSKYFFTKSLDPFVLMTVRLTCSAAILLVFMGWRHPEKLRLSKQDYKRMALLGILGMGCNHFNYLYAISQLNVATAIFLQYLAPILIAIYTIATRREKINLPWGCALLSATIGSAVLAIGGRAPGVGWPALGLVAGFISAFSLAFYTVYSKVLTEKYDFWTVLTYSITFGAIASWFVVPPWIMVHQHFTLQLWGFFLYICFFATIIPYALLLKGLKYIKASRASIISTMEPVMAGVLAYLILGETISKSEFLGYALILLGVVAVQIERKIPG